MFDTNFDKMFIKYFPVIYYFRIIITVYNILKFYFIRILEIIFIGSMEVTYSYCVSNIYVDVAQHQKRSSEDRYIAKHIGPYELYAVCDGHGGSHDMGAHHAADYVVNNLPNALATTLAMVKQDDESIISAIKAAFIQIDREMWMGKIKYGSTTTGVLINRAEKKAILFNLGDSKTVLCAGGKILKSSVDHHPNNKEEADRITNAGGVIIDNRVNGQLAVSRAFGDFTFKTIKNAANVVEINNIRGPVSALPDVVIFPLDLVENIVLSSDAPYEISSFTDNDFANYMQQKLSAKEIVDRIAPLTTDDVTVIVVTI